MLNALRVKLAKWIAPKGWHVQRHRGPRPLTTEDINKALGEVGEKVRANLDKPSPVAGLFINVPLMSSPFCPKDMVYITTPELAAQMGATPVVKAASFLDAEPYDPPDNP